MRLLHIHANGCRIIPKGEGFWIRYSRSINRSGKRNASEAGYGGRIAYSTADAQSYIGNFDILAFFDCLHDMGDPLGAARYAANHLNDDGMVILIEPSASDERSENMNTIGQMYYSFSTMGCVPTSKSQVGLALGAQAGPKKLIGIMAEAGFAKNEIYSRMLATWSLHAESNPMALIFSIISTPIAMRDVF